MSFLKKLFGGNVVENAVQEALNKVRKNPDELTSWINLASAYNLAGNNEKALEICNVLVKDHPNDLALWLTIATIHLDEDRISEVIDAANKAISIQETPLAHTLIGRAYIKNKQWENAITEYKRVIGRDDKNAWAWYWLGVAYEETSDTQSALSAYKKASELDPNNVEVYKRIASVQLTLHNFDQAISAMEQAARIEPKYKQMVRDMRDRLAKI